MDALKNLKALKDKLKQEKAELVGADKKVFTKGELEAAKLQKLRQEEEEERKRKELKRKQLDGEAAEEAASKQARKDEAKEKEPLPVALPREEVIRRLRALGQPATLFGEEDYDRLRRLLKAEKEVHVEDENRGGQQENVILELQRQERERAKQKAKEAALAAESAAKRAAAEAKAPPKSAQGPSAEQGNGEGTSGDTQPEDETMEAFKAAAKALAERRAEEALSVEERITKWIQRWMKEWEEDLDKRPDSVKATAVGHQATLLFGQTKKYLEPLYERLKHKALHEEMRAGLWMMVQAMRDRNYLYANDFYLRLAIGNAAWPIGVTSVGIHERSAREKISHVMNQSGQAHIMNDEATRKYLQAVKRLISAVQRMYPTVPSRSVDFETFADQGRGVAGAGSTKLALLQAEAQGQTVETLGLPAAPHFLDKDGKVVVPQKWEHILKTVKKEIGEGAGEGGREGSPAAPGRTASPAPKAAKAAVPTTSPAK